MPKTLTTTIPIERTRLANGLRVVFAPDRSSPAVFVAVYYDVGFRSEPKGRSGFAHLFEHLMFQGSATLEKGMHDSLVTGNGGILNGSTRNDFTNYFDMMQSNALEIALFLEADRMRAVRLTSENLQNQVDVVKEEILVNVKNQPYGGFPWLYLPMALFTTFPNAHDAYAEFDDYCATVLLSSILIDGEASRLYQRLVKTHRLASHVSGDVGLVAGTFEVRGPSMLHLAAWYPGTPDPDRILAAIDEEVSRV